MSFIERFFIVSFIQSVLHRRFHSSSIFTIACMQIAKELYHFFPKVGITTLKLPGDGLSFKFDPIHSFPGQSTSPC